MEKEISFLNDEFKSKNIVINLSLETFVKCEDNHHNKKRNIHSNHDIENTQSKKNG